VLLSNTVTMLARLHARLNLVQTTDVFRHDLARIEPMEPAPGVSIERLPPAALERALEVRSIEPWLIEERRERGDVCYLGLSEGRAGHFSWVQQRGLHPISDAGVSVPVRDGEIWVYHCHTAPWCRGRRLYPLVLSAILTEARAHGASRAWIYTLRDNESSRNGILRAGFVFDHSLRAVRLGPRRIRLAPVSSGSAPLGAAR
jgi:hypothetical protein